MTVPTSLPLTGERTVPGVSAENYWFRRHEAAYEWVGSHLRDRIATGVVVDAGCGEGYGIRGLAQLGARVALGLELDPLTAQHAGARYGNAVAMAQANLDRLPLRTGRVDLLISMQVVEHLWDLQRFLSDCRRAIAATGAAVFTTPNRLTFSPGLARHDKPTNPFHFEEFDSQQLVELVAGAGFEQVACFGLFHGARLTAWEAEHGSIVAAQIDASVASHGFIDGAGREWPPDLARAVAAVRTIDFEIRDVAAAGDGEGCLDLIVVAEPGAKQ